MSGTARGPHGGGSIFCLAALASALVLGSLASCSRRVHARPSTSTETALDGLPAFDSMAPKDWQELSAHSQRISPTPDWDGTVNGLKTTWFESGAKKSEGRSVHGRKEDAWTFWYENGQKRWEGTYLHDLVQGVERSWYENGAVCSEGTSLDGKRNGAFRAWYEDGQPWWNGDYQLGVRQGIFRYWHRNGTPDQKVSGVYVDGKRVKRLDPNGLAAAK